MSVSGAMAYGMLKAMTTIVPSMKEDFTDIDTKLAKAKKSTRRIGMCFRPIGRLCIKK